MTSLLRFILLIPAVLLPACADDGPSAPAAVVSASAASASAVSSGTGVWEFEGVGYLDCIGEEVLSRVRADYKYHLIENPNGDFVYVEQWEPQSMTGTLTGLTSGHVWTRSADVSPLVIRSAGGGMTQYTFRSQFVSETGPTLLVNEIYHSSRDAKGELRVDRSKLNCRVQ